MEKYSKLDKYMLSKGAQSTINNTNSRKVGTSVSSKEPNKRDMNSKSGTSNSRGGWQDKYGTSNQWYT